jgi:phytoene synthase
MERGATDLGRAFDSLILELEGEGLETRLLADMLRDWSTLVSRVASEEAAAHTHLSPIRQSLLEAAASLDHPSDRLAYFGRHAASFRFAARLFPRDALHKVAGVYAFCRFTDDLVDEAPEEDPIHLETRLTEWLTLARRAYDGAATGSPLLDDVMGDMRRAGVDFEYVEELVEGVRMDLAPREYGSMEELRTYSYRVASVVGGWLTELFGVRDPWVLERAYALGHAMQLTNILRDVGEDLRRGRLYLPEDTMLRHGVDRVLLEAVSVNPGPTSPGYRALLEELMSRAEEDYERAFQGIPFLPSFFRGPVAVAASVYRGIHGEIRRNAYDNLNRRARTSFFRKIILATRGLWKLRRTAASRAGASEPREMPRVGGRPPGEQEAAA